MVGDGVLSIAELADVFALSHVVKDAPVLAEQVDEETADMMEVETQLGSLVGESALSRTAGGILTRFFAYDVISFFLTAFLAYSHLQSVGLDGVSATRHSPPRAYCYTAPTATLSNFGRNQHSASAWPRGQRERQMRILLA